MTDYVNPKDHEEPVEQVLVKMTNGGVDHALECCGIPSCMVRIHLYLNFRFVKVHRTSNFFS
jgi:Zn-dependent alcohol dehydrogenase